MQAVKQEACPRVAVAGSKGTGKSTLARLLVNSLLNVTPVVAFLDTDCGQAELTVPGIFCPVHSQPAAWCCNALLNLVAIKETQQIQQVQLL